jgi:hypothetical protein
MTNIPVLYFMKKQRQHYVLFLQRNFFDPQGAICRLIIAQIGGIPAWSNAMPRLPRPLVSRGR